MPYTADAVANEFLDGRFGQITPMKLQKLVYYSHAWSLALFDEALISDRIEAWPYGPVIPTLYEEFKDFRNRRIDRFATELDEETLEEVAIRLPEDATLQKATVDRIWNVLGGYDAIQLSNMTHSKDEPWDQIRNRRAGLAIPDSLIKKCFKEIFSNRHRETE